MRDLNLRIDSLFINQSEILSINKQYYLMFIIIFDIKLGDFYQNIIK